MRIATSLLGSYYYNPYVKVKTYRRISETDSSVIMFMDLIRSDSLPHGVLGKQWVVGMSDGAVKISKSKAAWSVIESGNVGNDWSDYSSALTQLNDSVK